MEHEPECSANYHSWIKWFCWLGLLALFLLALVSGNKGEELGGMPSFYVLFGFALLICVPMILEVHFTEIRIEQGTIYTRSPWRQKRSIPLSSILSCDFSQSLLWYRIRTRNDGVIRIHMYMSGAPMILWQLPCEVPRKPIQFLDKDGNWAHPFDGTPANHETEP